MRPPSFILVLKSNAPNRGETGPNGAVSRLGGALPALCLKPAHKAHTGLTVRSQLGQTGGLAGLRFLHQIPGPEIRQRHAGLLQAVGVHLFQQRGLLLLGQRIPEGELIAVSAHQDDV